MLLNDLHLLACSVFVICNYLFADTASPPVDDWFVEIVRLVPLRYGCDLASAPGCSCDGTGTPSPPVFCGMTITQLKFACSRIVRALGAVYLNMSIALEIK